jgi:hypothetical protein
MDQLWALKKEFDPFRWSRFGPGAGLLAVLRCTLSYVLTVVGSLRSPGDPALACWEEGRGNVGIASVYFGMDLQNGLR